MNIYPRRQSAALLSLAVVVQVAGFAIPSWNVPANGQTSQQFAPQRPVQPANTGASTRSYLRQPSDSGRSGDTSSTTASQYSGNQYSGGQYSGTQHSSTQHTHDLAERESQSTGRSRVPVGAPVFRTAAFQDAAQTESPSTTAAVPPESTAPQTAEPDTPATPDPVISNPTPPANSGLATLDSVANRLNEIQADEALDPELKSRTIQTLESALAELRSAKDNAEASAGFDTAIANAPAEFAEAKLIVETADPDGEEFNVSEGLEMPRVREEKAVADAAYVSAREFVININKRIRDAKTGKESLPKQIKTAKEALTALQAKPVAEVKNDPDGILKQAKLAEYEAKIDSLNQLIKRSQRELAFHESQTDLLPMLSKVADIREKQTQAEASRWAEALQQQQEFQTSQELEDYKAQLERENIDPKLSLALKLQDSWLSIIANTARVAQQNTNEELQLAETAERVASTTQLVNDRVNDNRGLGASLALRLQLLQREQPDIGDVTNEITKVDDMIEDAQALQAEVELAVQGIAAASASSLRSSQRPSLPMLDSEIHPREKELLSGFTDDVQEYLLKLINRRGDLETRRDRANEVHALVESHVTWLQQHPRFDFSDLSDAWFALTQFFEFPRLKATAVAVYRGFGSRKDLLVLFATSLIMLTLLAPRIRRRLADLAKQASPMQVIVLKPTLSALMLTVALAVPLPLMMWVIGRAMRFGALPDSLGTATGSGIELAATIVLPLELLRQIVRPHGLWVAHFGGQASDTTVIRRVLRVLIDAGVPIIAAWSIAMEIGVYVTESAGVRRTISVEGSLGRLVFMFGMLLAAFAMSRAFNPRDGILSSHLEKYPNGWLSRSTKVWLWIAVSTPLLLAAVSFSGYSNAAVALAQYVYRTLWLGVCWMVCNGIMHRWLLVYRRNVAMAARKQQGHFNAKTMQFDHEDRESNHQEVAAINAQTSRLIQTSLLITVLVALFWIWSPVLSALQLLNVTLWDVVNAKGEVEHVTLKNLVQTIPILALTWVAVRNLPGLIEGILLERLPLDKPVRYAITALTTYVLATVGILIGAKSLGLRWDSIQWLVAALGVGIGFGMQEIFANFISGIILLFEQPIRVGDVVTIDSTTGVVTRIRIRATTVTNWDRQELIIPNKDLITGRLINWTLSDTTNRIVLNVGIAYGSNTRDACELLREICMDHPNIETDPQPSVTFEGFGDSTLDLVVRCFLGSMDNRLSTIHALHSEINRRFNEAGIEISFPQRDLHIRSLPTGFAIPSPGENRDAA